MRWTLGVMWPSIGDDMGCHWWRETSQLGGWCHAGNVRCEGGWSVMVGAWVLALIPWLSIFSTIGTFCWMRTKPRAHKPVWFLLFLTLQNLQHLVWMLYGDSTIWEGNKIWAVPVAGIGQGNGTGLQIWAVVSTPILDLHCQEGYGTAFKAAVSGDQIQFVGYSFVDNTDLIQTRLTITSTTGDTLPLMQAALNLWNSSLSTKGGGLVPEKSFWYSIDFKWRSGHWSYMPKHTVVEPLAMNNHLGKCLPLLRLHTLEARWTLEVYLALDGNNQLQATVLLEKTKVWAGTKHQSRTPWSDGSMAEHNHDINLASLLCPASNSLTPHQCHCIMRPCLTDGMAAVGYNWSFPRAIIMSAPSKYYGLNLTNMYTKQGIQHLLHQHRVRSKS